MKKIDIHCHTTKRVLPELAAPHAALDDIAVQMKRFDIEKTVVLASYFPSRGSGISNFRLLRWIQDRTEFSLFGSLDLEHYFQQGFSELEELAQERLIQGIKIYSGYQSMTVDPLPSERKQQLHQLARLAVQYSLPLMFHTGECHGNPSSKIPSPLHYEFLVAEHPVSFIFSHLSLPLSNDAQTLSLHYPNAYSDTSGLINSKHECDQIPKAACEIRRFLDQCGPDKLLFGTDFPIQTHEDSVYLVEEAMKSYSEKDKEKVYYENARRLLDAHE